MCTSSASTGLCGGQWVTSVPTATLNMKKCLPISKTHHGEIAFVERAGSRPKKGLGKADDIEEETGKCTRWDRRDGGPGIWGKICGDNIGNILLAAGAEWQPAETPETRL